MNTHAPYALLASLFDGLLGDRFFRRLRARFERLVAHHRIHLGSTADVACGTGTFVRYLCERGVPVVYGVDRSPEMLRVAITKNQGNGARFLCQSFATLQLPRPVELLTCHFDSLNYLLTTEELLRAFCRFRGSLNPGGYLVTDMITGRLRRDRRSRRERVTGPGVAVGRVTWWDPRRQMQTALVSIPRDGHSHREVHVQRGYPLAIVGSLLAQARLALCGAHDFPTLSPATAWTPRVVYVAQAV